MASSSSSIGTVVALWRFPVKSMQGEELNACHVGERGLLGDRAHALIDRADGKVASAKNPRKWPSLFAFRAVYVNPPAPSAALPAVRINLPDGTAVNSDADQIDATLSQCAGRPVRLANNASERPVLEEYWPDLEGLPHRDAVTDEAMPPNTFFDLGVVHLLTTATLDRLRELYPTGRFEVRRFRPNIVIAPANGASGFLENSWVGRTVLVGDEVRLRIDRACGRCVMTTLPQADLLKDPGILRTAVQHNNGHVGVYAQVERGGSVRRGDALRLE
jgi:uncharacterized protein YcbX